MSIWFNYEEKDLMIAHIESDSRPIVGDTIWVNEKEYIVKRVVWCLEKPPGQSAILVYVK